MLRCLPFVPLWCNCVLHCAESHDCETLRCTECAVELKLCSRPVYPWQFDFFLQLRAPALLYYTQCTPGWKWQWRSRTVVILALSNATSAALLQPGFCVTILIQCALSSSIHCSETQCTLRYTSLQCSARGSNCSPVHCPRVNWLWCIRLWGIGVQILEGTSCIETPASQSSVTVNAQWKRNCSQWACWQCCWYTDTHTYIAMHWMAK